MGQPNKRFQLAAQYVINSNCKLLMIQWMADNWWGALCAQRSIHTQSTCIVEMSEPLSKLIHFTRTGKKSFSETNRNYKQHHFNFFQGLCTYDWSMHNGIVHMAITWGKLCFYELIQSRAHEPPQSSCDMSFVIELRVREKLNLFESELRHIKTNQSHRMNLLLVFVHC